MIRYVKFVFSLISSGIVSCRSLTQCALNGRSDHWASIELTPSMCRDNHINHTDATRRIVLEQLTSEGTHSHVLYYVQRICHLRTRNMNLNSHPMHLHYGPRRAEQTNRLTEAQNIICILLYTLI